MGVVDHEIRRIVSFGLWLKYFARWLHLLAVFSHVEWASHGIPHSTAAEHTRHQTNQIMLWNSLAETQLQYTKHRGAITTYRGEPKLTSLSSPCPHRWHRICRVQRREVYRDRKSRCSTQCSPQKSQQQHLCSVETTLNRLDPSGVIWLTWNRSASHSDQQKAFKQNQNHSQ